MLWSAQSVQSAWVRDEAAAGRDSGRLVPVMIDETDPPLGFRQFQSIDLSRWKKRGKSAGVRPAARVDRTISAKQIPRPNRLSSPRPRAVDASLIASGTDSPGRGGFAAGGMVLPPGRWSGAAMPRRPSPSRQRIASPSTQEADARPAGQAWQPAIDQGRIDAIGRKRRDGGARRRSDLRSRSASESASPKPIWCFCPERTEAYCGPRTSSHRRATRPTCKQQLAYTAARVLDCALEALKPQGKRLLDQQTLQALSQWLRAICRTHRHQTPAEVIPLFTKVTKDAPWFEPGLGEAIAHLKA